MAISSLPSSTFPLNEINSNTLFDGTDLSRGISKRKASAFEPNHASGKRRCLESGRLPAASERTSDDNVSNLTRGSVDVPAHESLMDIMRRYRRQRLYVSAIAWTRLHLGILNVKFINRQSRRRQFYATLQIDAGKNPGDYRKFGDNIRTNATIKDHSHAIHNKALSAARQLGAANAEIQQSAMGTILGECELDCERVSWLELHYGGKFAQRIKTSGLYVTKSGMDLLACINLGAIRRIREKYIHDRNPLTLTRKRTQVVNGPVAKLRKIKLKRIEPELDIEDPYIASLLIAMAQEQRRRKGKIGNLEELAEEVHAVAFPFIRAQVAYFYKAVIPYAFLEKLQKLHKAVKCEGFTVSYVSVSLAVPEKALNRLMKLFCSNGLLHCAKAQLA